MRGALHTILGHSELLAVEARDANTRESADHIHTSAARLTAWVDDIIDLLRLPAVAERGETRLDVRALVAAPTEAAATRGLRVVVDEPVDDERIVVDQSVERIARRVLETVIATAKTDVEVHRESFRSGDPVAVICVAPIPEATSDAENGVLAIAARVFAARGGGLVRSGERLKICVPAGQSPSS
jgi:K+-sensing histidine kinase KdpD